MASLPTGTIGAIGELLASADLMRRGYHVFRALSPACPCDLLAYRASPAGTIIDPILRIQVRTARLVAPTGMLVFPLDEHDKGTFDVLALAVEGDGVYYVPAFTDAPTCPHPISTAQLERLHRWGILRGADHWQGLKPNVQPVLRSGSVIKRRTS